MSNTFAQNIGYEMGTKIFHWSFFNGYNLSIFFGFLMAFFTAAYFWHRNKIEWEHMQILIIIMMPSAILGARIYALITMTNPVWSDFFNFQGLSIYGGVIGAVGSGSIYVFFRRHTLDYRTTLGIMMPTILLGQAIGRWGNFSNHELYGQIVSGDSLNWMGGLKEHMNISNPHISTIAHYRAPIFFYEFMGTILAYILIVWVLLDRNWAKPGVTGMCYLIAYGIIRIILQTQRANVAGSVDYFPGSHVPMNYITSGIIIIVGISVTAWWQWLGDIASKKYDWIPACKQYKLITPVKDVRRFWVGPKYKRAFRIWIAIPNTAIKESKREINNKISKLQNKVNKKNNNKIFRK